MVVHGDDGLDEITITGYTEIAALRDGSIETIRIHPEEFGIPTADLESIKGVNKETYAKILQDVLDGKEGIPADVVLLNAAASLIVAGKAKNFKEGIAIARDVIRSGKAKEKLDALVAFSQELQNV